MCLDPPNERYRSTATAEKISNRCYPLIQASAASLWTLAPSFVACEMRWGGLASKLKTQTMDLGSDLSSDDDLIVVKKPRIAGKKQIQQLDKIIEKAIKQKEQTAYFERITVDVEEINHFPEILESVQEDEMDEISEVTLRVLLAPEPFAIDTEAIDECYLNLQNILSSRRISLWSKLGIPLSTHTLLFLMDHLVVESDPIVRMLLFQEIGAALDIHQESISYEDFLVTLARGGINNKMQAAFDGPATPPVRTRNEAEHQVMPNNLNLILILLSKFFSKGLCIPTAEQGIVIFSLVSTALLCQTAHEFSIGGANFLAEICSTIPDDDSWATAKGKYVQVLHAFGPAHILRYLQMSFSLNPRILEIRFSLLILKIGSLMNIGEFLDRQHLSLMTMCVTSGHVRGKPGRVLRDMLLKLHHGMDDRMAKRMQTTMVKDQLLSLATMIQVICNP